MGSLVPDYINYMETGLLEAIVERFEVEQAQKLLQKYHDRYPHLRQLSDMLDPVPDERLDLTRRKRLRSKCDGDFESARANDVKRIQMSIESATGIDHRFLTPAQHSEGSLILTFLIPESVSGIFQELCDEDLEILAKSGIVELHIDDLVISDFQRCCPQRMRSSAQSTGVPSADHTGTTAKGFSTYIEERVVQFTNKEKSQLTGLLKGVSRSSLEEVCTDSFLRQLAPHVGDWRKLAPGFGISELEAERLIHRHPDIEEQRYWALYCWKQINPDMATYAELVACLLANAPFELAKAAVSMLNSDAAVQGTRQLLQKAYLLQENQPLWPGAPALLQFDRRLWTPDSKQLKDINYSSRFETLEQYSSEIETLSIKSFLNSVTEGKKCYLIKGPPGSGKTALLQRVCAFWARGFCLRKFTLVLWLGLNTYHSIPSGASLRTLLMHSLPHGSHIDSIQQWVARQEAEDVLFVFDGVDNRGVHCVDNIIAAKTLKKATIILASSSTAKRYSFSYQYLTQYDLLGLSQEQILRQVIQHYCHNTSRAEEFLMYISEMHYIRALCSSPPYLATVLFVFDNVDTGDLPNTWTELFTSITLSLLRRYSVSDHDTLISKAHEVTSTNSLFDWHHHFTNFCTRITSPYRSMVAPADHCRFTLTLLQHYLCARHIHGLPRDQHVAKLNEIMVPSHAPSHVRQFYIGLCSPSERVKLVLKNPVALVSAAYISEIPVEGLQYLMSSQLTFKYQWLTTIDIHSIIQAVYHSGLPCKLQFDSCYYGCQVMEMIVKGLPILPNGGTLQELSVRRNMISVSGACILCGALQLNRDLQKLNLSNTYISGNVARALSGAFDQGLCNVDFSNCEISDDGAHALSDALKVNKSLLELDLHYCSMSDEGACVLARALKVNQSLQKLDLSQNRITDDGARALSEALEVNQHLQKLDISQNYISGDGAPALSGALKVNHSLRELDLHDSNISDEGADVLAGALKLNQSLHKLDLSLSRISDSGAHALSGALEKNKSLQELGLSHNKISVNGAFVLSGALRLNQGLLKLNLSDNCISDNGAYALSGALEVNQSLQELDLSGNSISSQARSALFEAEHKNKNLEIDLNHQFR